MNAPTDLTPARSPQVVIVGAGPIGIEMAVALRRRGLTAQIIEAGPIGQTMSWWAPQTRWFSSNERISIAGVPLLTSDQSKATREDYLTYLRSIVAQFDLSVRTFTQVTGVQRGEDGELRVTSCPSRMPDSSQQVQGTTTCRAVVLAIGGTDFPNRLNVPGESLPHVDGYLREPHQYAGRRVMIIGGRNSAAEAALRLHHAGAHVSICYRGESLPEASIKYWLTPELMGLIKAGRIKSYFSSVPHSIAATTITLRRVTNDQLQEVAADDVLSLIGYQQDKTLLQQAGVELVDSMQRPAHDPETMQTNVAGIYIAGTAVAGTQSSKYKTFLENCHSHVDKILAHLLKQPWIPGTLSRGGQTAGLDAGADALANDSAASVPAYEQQIAWQPES